MKLAEYLTTGGSILGAILFIYKQGAWKIAKKLINDIKELITEVKELMALYKELGSDGLTEDEIKLLFKELEDVLGELEECLQGINSLWSIYKKHKQLKGSKQKVANLKAVR